MYKTIASLAVLGLLTACSSNDTTSSGAGQNDQQNPGISTSSDATHNDSNASMNLSSSVNDQDRSFVHDAAVGGMSEVKEGELAGQHAANDQVRKFGEHMVADHTKANEELKQLATRKGISVPSDLDSKHQMAIDQLSKANGAGFDQRYVPDEVRDHQDTIALFRTEASKGQDSDIKAFATRTIPTLEHHLQMIQDLQKQMQSNMGAGNQGNPSQGSSNTQEMSPSNSGSNTPGNSGSNNPVPGTSTGTQGNGANMPGQNTPGQ